MHPQEHVEAAAKRARLQAEDELNAAAETDRAAHVASSLRKESSQHREQAAQVSNPHLTPASTVDSR